MDKHSPSAACALQVKERRLFFPPAQKHRTEEPLGWPPPALPPWRTEHHDPACIPAQQSDAPAAAGTTRGGDWVICDLYILFNHYTAYLIRG